MYKILIADDEQLERKALKQIIQQNMPLLEVVGDARNGDEALELAQEYSPDIVLLDIKMPGRTGLEAAREILCLNPEAEIIIVTAFDYFEYAQEAIHMGACDYLLKPVHPNDLLTVLQKCIKNIEGKNQIIRENKKIKEQLGQIWPQMVSSFINDLVNGYITEEKELEMRAGVLGINLLPSIAMVVGIENGDHTQLLGEYQCQSVRQKIYEVSKAKFKDQPSLLITPITGEKLLLLVPWNGDYPAENPYDFCRQRGEHIARELAQFNVPVNIGIGKYYQDVFMIRQSYLEALEALRDSSFDGISQRMPNMSYQQNDWVAQFREFQDQKESELIDLICSGDWERLREILDFLLNNVCMSDLGEDLQKAWALELLAVLYRSVIRTSNAQQMTVLNLSNVKRIMDSDTRQELSDCLYEAVKEIMELVQTGKKESLGLVITRVKSFIKNNFSKDITLEDAARHVYLSPCYLSRIFSKEVGVPFRKYLTNVKLDYARRLLLSTNKPINEIALEAGYQDISYFCRTFKQYEGIPPHEYRNINSL